MNKERVLEYARKLDNMGINPACVLKRTYEEAEAEMYSAVEIEIIFKGLEIEERNTIVDAFYYSLNY